MDIVKNISSIVRVEFRGAIFVKLGGGVDDALV